MGHVKKAGNVFAAVKRKKPKEQKQQKDLTDMTSSKVATEHQPVSRDSFPR